MAKIDFRDRVAIVTGAGGGLGKTYALELARRGCRVVVNDPGVTRDGHGPSQAPADGVVAEIQALGGEAVANHDGVETRGGGESIVAAALDHFGRLDIVIHNAGILRDRTFAKMTEEDWISVMNVHLNGAYYVLHPAWQVMRDHQYGRLLVTTSVSGLFGNFGQANYGAAKMGLVGLMNVLAIEGAKYHIKVNGLSPTAMTRMTEDLDRSKAPSVSRDPAHVTPAALYLVSEACQESGAIIHAGHGFYGRLQVAHNQGIFLGKDPVTVETLAARWNEITDLETLKTQEASSGYLAHVYSLARSEPDRI